MGTYFCRQCGNRLYPPANSTSVRCPRCGGENRLLATGSTNPLAALTEPPAVAAAEVTGATAADDRADIATIHVTGPESPDFREANPFADSDQRQSGAAHGATAQLLNPYAPPTAISTPLDEDFLPASARVGLPWQHSTSLGSWFATAVRVAFTPTIAFRQMKLDDDYNGALYFSVHGALVGWLILMCGMAVFIFATAPPNAGSERFGFAIGYLLVQLVCGGFAVAIGVAVRALLSAALFHIGLMLMGASRNGFGTTLQVVAYTHGSMLCALPLMVIPFVSILPSMIWTMVILVCGLREAQQTTTAKAILSVVLPTFVCGGAISIIILYRMGMAPFGIPMRP